MNSAPWLIVTVVLIEVILIVAIANPESVEEARANENASTVTLLGPEHAGLARTFAITKFQAHFVESGLLKDVNRTFVPTAKDKAKATGLEEFVPDVFRWATSRLEGLWGMIFGAYHRIYVMAAIGIACVPFVVSALIDGLVVRKISLHNNDVGKPVFFHGAKKAAVTMLVMPIALLFYPATLNPSIWCAWVLIFPCVLWIQAANVQEL